MLFLFGVVAVETGRWVDNRKTGGWVDDAAAVVVGNGGTRRGDERSD